MTELTLANPESNLPSEPLTKPPVEMLNRAQKAAIIIGILGAEGAGPLLEQMPEPTLRKFAAAMSQLRQVQPEVVQQVIREFLYELDRMDATVKGGISQARDFLKDYVADSVLNDIVDDVAAPGTSNIWKKLAEVDEQALAEFLTREHPQTAAVVLSKLSAEHAAQILGRLDADRAREMVFGLTKAATLDSSVIDAIGYSVGEDFLANHRGGGAAFKPAERIGTIMNFTTGDIRQAVLNFLDETQPELADAVKGSMFTFQDIQDRVERRDVAAIVRNVEPDALMKALKGAEQNAAATAEFFLTSISSRMAEQLREQLAEVEKVKIREAEDAQNTVLRTIREMEAAGELKLLSLED